MAVQDLVRVMENLGFPEAVIGSLLAVLLFAGVMQVNLPQLHG